MMTMMIGGSFIYLFIFFCLSLGGGECVCEREKEIEGFDVGVSRGQVGFLGTDGLAWPGLWSFNLLVKH